MVLNYLYFPGFSTFDALAAKALLTGSTWRSQGQLIPGDGKFT